MCDLKNRFSGISQITELTPEIVKEFIKEIRVFSKDKIEVVLNYQDNLS